MKFALAEGKASNEDSMLYQTLSNSLRRLLKQLGIKREPRERDAGQPSRLFTQPHHR